MSHVNHQQGTDFIGDFAHTGIVPFTAVSTATTDNQLGLVFLGKLLHLVVIYTASLFVQIVAYGLVENTRRVDQRTVRKVTTVVKVQTHEHVAWLQYGQQYGGIGLGA